MRAGSPFGKHNVESARNYLAGLAGFKPQKPLSDYKPDQLVRKANAFIRQESVGLAPNNALARGLHRGEKIAQQQTTVQEYKQSHVKTQRQPPSQRSIPNAKRVLPVSDTAGARSALRKFGRVAHDQNVRVKISFYDKRAGRWRTVGQKGGFTKKKIREYINEGGGLFGGIAAAYAVTYDDEIELDDIGDVEFFSVLLGDA